MKKVGFLTILLALLGVTYYRRRFNEALERALRWDII